MSFTCGFFNSVNGDRKYTAEQMNNPYAMIVSNGVIAKTEDSDSLQVLANGEMQLVVKKGTGIFAGKWAVLDSDMIIDVPTTIETRIDSVIVRIDESVRSGSIVLEQGDYELVNNSTISEYRLARIRVLPTNAIYQSDIQDTRPTSECGFVTNLLQDSDITATYAQWQAQFEEWLAANESWAETKKTEHEGFIETEQAEYNSWTETKRLEYENWFNTLTSELIVNNALQFYSSHYVTTEENETNIPINIFDYTSNLDVLKVYINGLMLIPLVDYTINDFSTITLTKPVDVGTTINFNVLKIVVATEEVESVAYQLQRVNSVIPAECCETNILVDEQTLNTELENINTTQYTFIVDSDEALSKWANNDTSNGEDYTSVFIKKGTWTSSVGVNLTTAGTKVVVGEDGNLLVFENVEQGLYYESLSFPTETTNYIQNVNLSVTGEMSKGFCSCSNLTNCKSNAVYAAYSDCLDLINCKGFTSATTSYTYAFEGCKNLTNCYGRCEGSFSATAQQAAVCFQSCFNLTNCIGQAFVTSVSDLHDYASAFYESYNLTNCIGFSTNNEGYSRTFSSCTNLTNCMGFGAGKDESFVFSYCSKMSNCHGEANNIDETSTLSIGFYECTELTGCEGKALSGVGTGNGFNTCTNLTNCIGTATGSRYGYAFSSCTNLTNCKGTGTGSVGSGIVNSNGVSNCEGTGTGTTAGYGFSYCNGVSKCKTGGNCSTSVFEHCYASQTQGNYPCADTPEGGFNDTTNPDAE